MTGLFVTGTDTNVGKTVVCAGTAGDHCRSAQAGALTLRTGMAASEEEIISFCREHIAHFKCPTAVEFRELPKTSTGKVQKFVLREREWAGKQKRIN